MSKTSSTVNFGGRIPAELARACRILSAKQDRSIQDVLAEALRDVLKKHGEKVPRE